MTLHRLQFRAMGSDMLAVVESEAAPSLLAQVPAWFEEWEQVLSRFRFDSELTRLNQIHDRPVQVSDILWEVFQAAREAEQRTNGLVTPTVLEAIIEAGYDRPFDVLPPLTKPRAAPAEPASHPLEAITADPSARTITLPEGFGLDFGGVAKGWAAHQAMKRLQAEDLEDPAAGGAALMDAGGDIAISGPRADGGSWQVGVADPFHAGQEIEALYLEQCGVATSGKNRRRWLQGNKPQHHIIDPSTSQPAETNVLTATVIAPTVMEAEAAAKTVVILGGQDGLAWIESDPSLAGLLVLEDRQVLYSQRMEEYL